MVPEYILRKYPILRQPLTPLLHEGLLTYGVREWEGPRSNPTIIKWARDLGLDDYKFDAQEWCTIWLSWLCWKLKLPLLPKKYLKWSQAYARYGTKREGDPQLGDIVITWRKDPSGLIPDRQLGHVQLFVEITPKGYWRGLGANQGDKVSIIDRIVGQHNLVDVRVPPDPIQ